MHISIIGASAGVGLEAVKIALERNHRVTTLSRSVIGIEQNTLLTSIRGDALSRDDLSRAIKGADAVLVTLGLGKSVMGTTTLFSDFAQLLVGPNAIELPNAPFIILTGFGSGESYQYLGTVPKMVFKTVLKEMYKDKDRMEQILLRSSLPYIIVRAGMLTNGPLTGEYRAELKLYKGMDVGKISRKDVAHYMVNQAENTTHLREFVSLTY